jgi:nucleoside-diphosphate-sugar epimerase
VSVLVTGGTGVVGRWVVRELHADGEQVHVAGRTASTAPLPSGVVPHDVDLLDALARQELLGRVRPQAVVHLAWVTTHGRFWHAAQNADWEEATVRLGHEVRRHGAHRLVVAGTCAEYDWSQLTPDGRCVEGSTPVRPTTAYGRAKAGSLRRLSTLPDADAWLAWARVFSPYGPGEAASRLVPSLVTALLEGRAAHVANPLLVRDYLHAQQVGRGLVALLRSEVGGAVNVASGVPLRLGELARRAATAVGRPDLVQLGDGSTQPGEPARLLADVTRLRDEVGFEPDVDLDAGLRDVVAWWRGAR